MASEADGEVWPRDPDGTPHYPLEERGLDPEIAARRIAAGDRHMWRLDMEKALLALGDTPLWPTGHLPPRGGDRTGNLTRTYQEPSVLFSLSQGREGAAGQSLPLRGRWPVGQRGVNSALLSWLETGSGAPEKMDGAPSVWGDVVLWRWDAPSSYHLSVVLDDALQAVTHVVRGLDLMPATPVHRLLQTLLGLPAPEYHHHRLLKDEDGEKLAKSRHSTGLRALREQGISASDIRRRIGLVTGA
ncbi:tRNA glutamyl-Q(34) synthetase GluQRS [Rhizobium sp. KVB221]|uniref:tRNA glutamyl-Q(34) synthetase GluQRS n=2 Tax=Rhizobium setariae TaxID=2801340 RepID=A0A936YLP0_9HYPH|nr:tRNA glutamyl-Q(34) synthetase GluQRS [Rhizobium setariae]